MKIINKTNYDTLSIKKLFTRCLVEDEKVEGLLMQKERLRVIVKYSNGDGGAVRGVAIIGGTKITMRIPRNNIEERMEAVAWVFIHELAHIRGYRHKQITNEPYREMVKFWANEYKIEIKKARAETKVDLKVIRYEHVCKKLEEKGRALKRIQKQIKKWNSKKKYYERTLMAAQKS